MMKILLILVSVPVVLVSLGWLGLRIKPAPLPAFPQQSGELETVPLPEDLPAPVQRFYRQVYGENLPVIESFVVTGRAKMRIMGITFPSRFRFTHIAGQDYRHYIETTMFGLSLMKVNEHYLDGVSRLELPFGVEEGPKVDQGANLGLWAETLWFPSIFITDARVRWEPIDEETALLIVPFGEKEQRFVARFDPETGMLQFLESMRYKSTKLCSGAASTGTQPPRSARLPGSTKAHRGPCSPWKTFATTWMWGITFKRKAPEHRIERKR